MCYTSVAPRSSSIKSIMSEVQVQVKNKTVSERPIIPRIKPAVPSPFAFPNTALERFLPIIPNINASSEVMNENTEPDIVTPSIPRTSEAIEKPLPAGLFCAAGIGGIGGIPFCQLPYRGY